IDVGPSKGGRPLQLEVTLEHSFDLEGVRGFNFKGDHRSRFVHWYKQSFFHREGVAAISDLAHFRAHADCPHQKVGGQAAAFSNKMQMEVAEKFKRVNPRFHIPALVAEESGAHF